MLVKFKPNASRRTQKADAIVLLGVPPCVFIISAFALNPLLQVAVIIHSHEVRRLVQADATLRGLEPFHAPQPWPKTSNAQQHARVFNLVPALRGQQDIPHVKVESPRLLCDFFKDMGPCKARHNANVEVAKAGRSTHNLQFPQPQYMVQNRLQSPKP